METQNPYPNPNPNPNPPILRTATPEDALFGPILTALVDDNIRDNPNPTFAVYTPGYLLKNFPLTPIRQTKPPTTQLDTPDPPPLTPTTSTQRDLPKTPLPPTRKRTYAEATRLGLTSPILPRDRPDVTKTAPKDGPDPTRQTERTTGLPQRPDRRPPTPVDMFTRHEHRGDKTRNWSLTPVRPVLILGASNMARLPPIYNRRVQVDCFPGARTFNAIHMIKYRTPFSPQVILVILHFGLNDRAARDYARVGRDMMELRRVTCDTFPAAEVRLAMLNVSPRLDVRVAEC